MLNTFGEHKLLKTFLSHLKSYSTWRKLFYYIILLEEKLEIRGKNLYYDRYSKHT